MGKAVSALESQREALAKAKRFLEKALVRCREIGIEFIGLYIVGSRARGDYTIYSDIDLVLVLKNIKNLNTIERIYLFKDLLEPGIELRIYDADEWFSNDILWIVEMKKEAIEIASLNKTTSSPY
uniref:Nucleotidyltransferase domain-containing protein n=1 Tax=Ignisphaera aggregans TaxID=334771 RepID=A0A7C5TI43_9CREN